MPPEVKPETLNGKRLSSFDLFNAHLEKAILTARTDESSDKMKRCLHDGGVKKASSPLLKNFSWQFSIPSTQMQPGTWY